MDYGLSDYLYHCMTFLPNILRRPDLCDGGYDAYCDKARKYTNISAILTAGGAGDVLSYMQKYWKDYQGDDEDLWSHEWSKHGTCVSTMEIKCYTNYRAQQEVVDYFNATTALFKVLPTYETLAAAGVLPSNSRTWTAEEIQIPLEKMHGTRVTLRCRGKMLDEVWYHFSVRGPVQTGKFVAAEPDRARSNCPGTGIRYIPKSSSDGSSRTKGPTASQPVSSVPSPTSTAAPFTGKGYLEVFVKGDSRPRGCLISQGKWYVGGTCARFQVQDQVVDEELPTTVVDQQEPRMFTVDSSKGRCGIVGHKLQCSKNLATRTLFSTTSNGTLSYDEHTSFYAKAVPSRFQKGDVFTVKPTGSDVIEMEMVWSRIGFTP